MKNKLAVLIATWFYTGLIPPIILKGMAGTYGSLFSIPLVWGTLWLAGNVWSGLYWVVFMAIYLLGILAVPRAEITLDPRMDWGGTTKTHDQNQIVIDETLGMLATCYPLFIWPRPTEQSTWIVLLIGFALFRFFDIIKIPPTRYFDRMQNAAGVMMDDVVAGIYAGICLTLITLGWYKILIAVAVISLTGWLEEYTKQKRRKRLTQI